MPATPNGDEFRVNTFTQDNQITYGPFDGDPRMTQSIAADADGNFVVVWSGQGQDDPASPTEYGVYAQLYNSAGDAVGSPILVNAGHITTGNQHTASVSMDADGDFIVTWSSLNYYQSGDKSQFGVFAQRYNSSGVAQGSTISVNETTLNNQKDSAITTLSNGDFIVTWTSDTETEGTNIYARRFSGATGTALGGEMRVNSTPDGDQAGSAIAVDSLGRYVVVWESQDQDGSGLGIYAQIFDADGTALGTEFLVNKFTTGNQKHASVAMDADGDFVITWSSEGQDGGEWGVYARRFAIDDSAATKRIEKDAADVLINRTVTQSQQYSSVAMDADGNYVISWTGVDDGAGQNDVYYRRFYASGTAIDGTSEFTVNTHTTNNQQFSSVAIDGNGNFIVGWSSEGQDGSASSVHVQRYNSAIPANNPPTKVNLTPAEVNENAAASTVVGELSTVDADAGDTHTYTLVTGTDAFEIVEVGGKYQLQVKDGSTLDYEALPAGYTVQIKTDDGKGGTRTEDIKITVKNVNEKPTDILLSNDQITENSAVGTVIGIITGIDPENDSLIFELVTGALDNSMFSIVKNTTTGNYELRVNGSFNYETDSQYTIQVIAREDKTGGLTYTEDITLTVVNTNEAPIVDPSNDAVVYNKNSGTVKIDDAVLVSDPDGNNLTQAVVVIEGYVNGEDILAFTNTAKITGTFDAITGTLTLTGTASVAEYQAALRSVTYRNNSTVFTGTERTLRFTVTDEGNLTSSITERLIQFDNTVNNPPVVSTDGTLSYNEGGGAVAIDATISVSDPENNDLKRAVIVIEGYVKGEDILSFTNTAKITGLFDAETGTLTLSGTATLAEYQAALRSITYTNTSNNPTTTDRILHFTVTDSGNLVSTEDTRIIQITPVNDAPIVSTNGALDYAEGNGAVVIDATISVSDPESNDLTQAVITIEGYVKGEDLLAFTNTAKITGTFDADTGKLTLTGTATLAEYQAALRSITYENTSSNPTTTDRILHFTATDTGNAVSAEDTRTIRFNTVNDPPVVNTSGTLNYSEGDGAVVIDATITVSDPENNDLTQAVITIEGYVKGEDLLAFTNTAKITGLFDADTGTLTLTGTATLAEYQAALRSITYTNTSNTPTITDRILHFTVTDSGNLKSLEDTRIIQLTPVNNAPVVNTSGTLNYNEGNGAVVIDATISVSDPESNDLTQAVITIEGYVKGEDLLAFTNTAKITGTFDADTGTLTLTGAATLAEYQAALRSITYTNTSNNPTGPSRTLHFTVTDSGNAVSAEDTRIIQLTPVNNAPVVNTSGTLNYNEGDGAVVVDGTITVSDPESNDLKQAVISIEGYVKGEDLLAFTNTAKITGTFDADTGKLTLTGAATLAEYQAALRSITYTNTSNNPTGPSRTLHFTVTDSGNAVSAEDTRIIQLTPVNNAPVVNTSGTLNYNEGDGAVVIDGTITVSDPESNDLKQAVISIEGYVKGEDLLAFTNTAKITGTFDADTGKLTLTGAATLAEYQAALRSITYTNTSNNPTGPSRTLHFTVTDSGNAVSAEDTRIIQLTPVNNAPVVNTSGTLNYNEGDGAVVVDGTITVSDPESNDLKQAVISIEGYVKGEDLLAFTNTAKITGTFDADTGTLTLTGTATLAEYQAALRSITYENTSNNPISSNRTLHFTVTDSGNAVSAEDTRVIQLNTINDPPSVTTTNSILTYNENAGAQTIDLGIVVEDIDSLTLKAATIAISGYVKGEDLLTFTNTGAIKGTFDSNTGTLKLVGVDSLKAYQDALRSITYTNTSEDPSSAERTIQFSIIDGAGATSNVATRKIQVVPINDAPVITTGGTLNYSEGSGAVAIDPAIDVSDVDSDNLSKVTITIGSYIAGEDLLSFTDTATIQGTFDADTGTLTLTGKDSLAAYRAALRTITYTNSSSRPNAIERKIRFTATDEEGLNSSVAERKIQINAVNEKPTVATSSGTLTYNENAGALTIDSGITVSDADSSFLTEATIAIEGYAAGDQLDFSGLGLGINGAFDATKGILRLTGKASIANYQAALSAITYTSTSENPGNTTRTIQFSVKDDGSPGLTSNVATRTIQLRPANDAPVITSGGTLSYTENAGAVAIDSTLNVVDVDSANLTGATIVLNGYVANQDQLGFTNQNGITGKLTQTAGKLTLSLSGKASVEKYQQALRSITYTNTSDNPNAADRTVTVNVTDGSLSSDTTTRKIEVLPVNDAPTVTVSEPSIIFPRTDGAITIDPGLNLKDPDSARLTGATIVLKGYVPGEDRLLFADQNGITGSFNGATGTLKLEGTASVANYRTALRSIIYTNTSRAPKNTLRTVEISATDGTTRSNTATVQIRFDKDTSLPVLDLNGSGGGLDFSSTFVIKGPSVSIVSPGAQLTDPDSKNLTSAQVVIANPQNWRNEELLVNTQGTGITASYNREQGTLILKGTASVATYLKVLRSVKYQNHSINPDRTTRTILFSVSDGVGRSEPAQTIVQITKINLLTQGTTGNDSLETTPATDLINAQAGNDTLSSILDYLQQNDKIDGGSGNDTFILKDGTGAAVVDVGNTINQVGGILTGNTTIRNFEYFDFSRFRGSATMLGRDGLSDRLTSGSGNDIISGAAGNDRLTGNAGNDYLDGGTGNDTLDGGTGDDTYVVDSLGDQIVGEFSVGFDRVIASIDWTLSNQMDDLMLTGSAVVGSGNDLNNGITGNAVGNLLVGNFGNDILIGLAGKDTLLGGEGNDSFQGGNGKDRLNGGIGNDRLDGGAGRDVLIGRKGKDRFFIARARKSNRDIIKDFNSADDTIQVSRKGFSRELKRGKVKASQFVLGSRANDASDRFIYEQSTGTLFFDRDGIGGAEQVQFAKLSNRASLSRSDISVIQ